MRSEICNAIDFLLFNYFGLSYENYEDNSAITKKAIEVAYKDATNQGAFNSLFIKNRFPDYEEVKVAKNTFFESASILIESNIEAVFYGRKKLDEGLFNDWHYRICVKLLDLYSNCFKGISGADPFFTYGNAQKMINMTLKNLYIISGAYLAMGVSGKDGFFSNIIYSSPLFKIPIDNIILGCYYSVSKAGDNCGVKKHGIKEPYYHIDDGFNDYPWSKIPDYDTYIKIDEKLNSVGGENPIDWECKNWIKRKKKLKEFKNNMENLDNDL